MCCRCSEAESALRTPRFRGYLALQHGWAFFGREVDVLLILALCQAKRKTDLEKEHTYLYQPVSQINAANIKDLMNVLNGV